MGKFTFLLIVIMTPALAIELPCRYTVGTDRSAGLYYCDLNNSIDVPDYDTHITSVSGKHIDQQSNADVVGFGVNNKTLHHLPRGLEKYFVAEKIKFIDLQATGLKGIHQADLKPFTKMTFFSAWNNNLRVLARDLFKYNPELTFIGLGRNKIKYIDGNIFKNLNNLGTVYLDGNACVGEFVNSEEMVDYKEKLENLAQLIRQRCSPYGRRCQSDMYD